MPALAQLFADYQSAPRPWPLRLFMLSGDWIPLGLPAQLKQLAELEVLSLGGATEASIWSIYYPVRQTRSDWKSIPYGYPMTNQSFYVLDQSLQPRPNQVPGELYIGGIGLAKGYWGDEEKPLRRLSPTRLAASASTAPAIGACCGRPVTSTFGPRRRPGKSARLPY